jgi:nicotinamidase-related amidase
MDDATERRVLVRKLVAAARAAQVPVIFIQEVHRPDMVDFGRELEGPRTCIASRG